MSSYVRLGLCGMSEYGLITATPRPTLVRVAPVAPNAPDARGPEAPDAADMPVAVPAPAPAGPGKGVSGLLGGKCSAPAAPAPAPPGAWLLAVVAPERGGRAAWWLCPLLPAPFPPLVLLPEEERKRVEEPWRWHRPNESEQSSSLRACLFFFFGGGGVVRGKGGREGGDGL